LECSDGASCVAMLNPFIFGHSILGGDTAYDLMSVSMHLVKEAKGVFRLSQLGGLVHRICV